MKKRAHFILMILALCAPSYGYSRADDPSQLLDATHQEVQLNQTLHSLLDWRWWLGLPSQSGSKVAQDGRDKPVTFADVGGAKEAKNALEDVVSYLKNPDRLQKLGGRGPKGVLLLGPPGTGKTLLARAVAGEAGVRFFSASGSEFDEMFVGEGAARVRRLFAQARYHAPSIIFIDEIDAVGEARRTDISYSSERAKTLNQLLIEMDGFQTGASGVIVLAATNRPEILDEALVRSGRFDRRVTLSLPDESARLQILKIHTESMPLADDVELEEIAANLPPMSGADLANLTRTAAMYAARAERDEVNGEDWASAQDDIIFGVGESTRLSDSRRRTTAIHEAGHAMVATLLPAHPGIKKVTVKRRGRAAGHTQLSVGAETPDSHEEMLAHVATMLGGRVAEELVNGTAGAGASDDLTKATTLARQMVFIFGMGAKTGIKSFAGANGFETTVSEASRAIADRDVSLILAEAESLAMRVLKNHREAIDDVVDALLMHETLDAESLDELLARGPSFIRH